MSEADKRVIPAKLETSDSYSLHPHENTIAMFLGGGGLEKGLVSDTEWNVPCTVIAAVQVRRKAAIWITQDVSKKTFL